MLKEEQEAIAQLVEEEENKRKHTVGNMADTLVSNLQGKLKCLGSFQMKIATVLTFTKFSQTFAIDLSAFQENIALNLPNIHYTL